MDFSAKTQRQPLKRLDNRICVHFVGGVVSLSQPDDPLPRTLIVTLTLAGRLPILLYRT